AGHGERVDGWPRYRRLLDGTREDMIARGAEGIMLNNGIPLFLCLNAWIFLTALADREQEDGEYRLKPGTGAGATGKPAPAPTSAAATPAAVAPASTPASSVARARGSDPLFEQPVFIVSAPRSGSTLLFETLSGAPGVHTIGNESHHLIEGIPALNPMARGYDSNRLLESDAT